ncbi:MAG TPA: DUF3299 domain-containing protein [Casimicrobiaceae bacterium]
MRRLSTRLLGLLMIPAAAAWAFTSEPPSSNALPSASDYSQTALPERSDTLSWKTLGQVEPRNEKGKLIPIFSKEILALDKKDVKVIGFMVPIEPDAKHKHFVLSAVPPSCPFCMPAGPESMVEVRLKSGIDYDINPIVVSGKFAVRSDDPRGVFYSLTEGVPVTAAPVR